MLQIQVVYCRSLYYYYICISNNFRLIIKQLFLSKHLNKLIETEVYEPILAWGFRMAIAVIIPLFYALYYGVHKDIMWVIITTECICWIELKGSFAQRVRVLLGGAFLAVTFGLAGSISSNILWLSLVLMIPVVFLSILLKNLGERGSTLSLTVYVMFIITNAYPLDSTDAIYHRCTYIAIGGLWSFIVGLLASLFIKEHTPFKRSVAHIWRAVANLVVVIDSGWDGKTVKLSVREIYLKEKEVDATIESSLQLFEKRAYHKNHESEQALRMAQLRKSVYLINTSLMSLNQELRQIPVKEIDGEQRQAVHDILKSIELICNRMTIYTVNAKPEEKILISSKVKRAKYVIIFLKENSIISNYKSQIDKFIHLAERILKLIENAILQVQSTAHDVPVFQFYSLTKTLLILHPKNWFANIKSLTHINTHSVRYALRTTIITTFAVFVYKFYNIPFGYWIPFTILIIAQPYFNATFKKAIDRVLGTVTGVLFADLLLGLWHNMFMKEIILITSPILMVYFIRKNYSVATFFISMFLVALFAVENRFENSIILARALSTVA